MNKKPAVLGRISLSQIDKVEMQLHSVRSGSNLVIFLKNPNALSLRYIYCMNYIHSVGLHLENDIGYKSYKNILTKNKPCAFYQFSQKTSANATELLAPPSDMIIGGVNLLPLRTLCGSLLLMKTDYLT